MAGESGLPPGIETASGEVKNTTIGKAKAKVKTEDEAKVQARGRRARGGDSSPCSWPRIYVGY